MKLPGGVRFSAGVRRGRVSDASVYEFADIQVDLARMVVTRDGAVAELEPKAFDVLRLLIEYRDRLVTKDELLDQVWRGTFVTPNVLTRAIAQVRKAIGDDAYESKYIETVAKRGYRFIAPVNAKAVQPIVAPSDGVALREAAPRPVAPAATARTRQLPLTGAVLFVIAGAAVAFVAVHAPKSSSATSPTTFPSVRRMLGSSLGYYGEPTLSPDGRSIAYAADEGG